VLPAYEVATADTVNEYVVLVPTALAVPLKVPLVLNVKPDGIDPLAIA
jgi:hypothetical protein